MVVGRQKSMFNEQWKNYRCKSRGETGMNETRNKMKQGKEK